MNDVTELLLKKPSAIPISGISKDRLRSSLNQVVTWLDRFGENSQDLYDFFACPYGQWAKRHYYKGTLTGKALVAPLVLMESFAPGLRSLFWHKTRFPLADAHYAMGFAYFYQATLQPEYLACAKHFLEILIQTRCKGYPDYCWGYPFDWETCRGNSASGTPFITSIPYCYEAFSAVNEIEPSNQYQKILQSIAEHVLNNYPDLKGPKRGYAAAYSPVDRSMVVNASAYRAFMLTRAAKDFADDRYWQAAERNLDFVLSAQLPDGSWLYSVDGPDKFTDHFHTCFVMKALTKIALLVGHQGCWEALERGAQYYLNHLVDTEGLPVPFSRKPRLILYKRELYDYAECINLCLLLRERVSECDRILQATVQDLLSRWQHPDGFFRTRQLLLGWNNVPMHRWGHSVAFRSLCLLFLKLFAV